MPASTSAGALVPQDLARGAFRHHLPVAAQDKATVDAVEDRAGLVFHDKGGAARRQQKPGHLPGGSGRKAGGGFVGKGDGRPLREERGQRNALPFASRQRRDAPIGPFPGDAGPRHGSGDDTGQRCGLDPAVLRGEGDLVAHGETGQRLRRILEEIAAGIGPVGRSPAFDGLAPKRDRAPAGAKDRFGEDPRHGMQKGGLPDARWPEQQDAFALAQVQRNRPDRVTIRAVVAQRDTVPGQRVRHEPHGYPGRWRAPTEPRCGRAP